MVHLLKNNSMHEILELDLYNEITAHYERYYKLQPLTAKVYSFFIFNNCQDGMTFDYLVEVFQVSKSSMSNSIKTLIELEFIEDFKLNNERKRHFKVNKKLFLMRLTDVKDKIINEKKIYIKFRDYKKSIKNVVFNQDAFDLYIDHLDDTASILTQTIENLNLYISKNEN